MPTKSTSFCLSLFVCGFSLTSGQLYKGSFQIVYVHIVTVWKPQMLQMQYCYFETQSPLLEDHSPNNLCLSTCRKELKGTKNYSYGLQFYKLIFKLHNY